MLATFAIATSLALADPAPAAPDPPPPSEADPDGPAPEAPAETPTSDWISLETAADFDTALRTVDASAEEVAAQPGPTLEELIPVKDLLPAESLAGREAAPRAHARGRFFARPRMSAVGLGSDWTMAAGATGGHQWWTLGQGRVKPVGETHFTALGLLGAPEGHDLTLTSDVGLWLGPVLLSAGGLARHDRVGLGEGLPAAFSGGPRLGLGASAGPLTLRTAAAPTWTPRPGLDQAPGDELGFSAELGIDRALAWRLAGDYRATAAGPLWSGTLGLHLQLL